MLRFAYGLCYAATIGTVVAAISERDVLEWTGVAIAAGASLFAWGLGRYHEYRKQRREEDHQDRLNMIEDIRAHTRILCEMETRQESLKKSMDVFLADIDRAKFVCHAEDVSAGNKQDA